MARPFFGGITKGSLYLLIPSVKYKVEKATTDLLANIFKNHVDFKKIIQSALDLGKRFIVSSIHRVLLYSE